MRHRLLIPFSALGPALGLVLFCVPSAEAAFNANYYRIRPTHSNKCLDVANTSPDNAARIQQWDCNPVPQANQLWRFTLQPNGTTYMVTSLHSGRCLDVSSVSAITGQPIPNGDNSAALQQWECNPFSPQPNQTFLLEHLGGSSYRFRSSISSNQRCLDVSDVSQSNGAAIQQWDCAPWAQANQIFVLELAAPPNQPTYFGYLSIGNSTAQTADHSNLTGVSGAVGTLAPKLAEAASLGMHAQVALTGLFFNEVPGAVTAKTDTEIQSNWNAVASEVSPYIDTVAAFFVLDEPYSHNASGQGLSQAAMKAKLAQIAAMIHATFPTTAVAVIFQAIPSHFDIPAGFNWVAFDCYEAWDNCYGYSIRAYHQMLKAQLSPGQKIFLVPGALLNGQPSEQEVIAKANHYADLAYSDPDVIAIIPFHYDVVSPNGLTPTIRIGFVDIGKAITGR